MARFLKKYINYLALFLCLIGLVGLLFFTDAADAEITFADPGVEAAIRQKLGLPMKPLHASQLSKITELDASNFGITTLDDLAHLSNLTVLNLEGNNIQDVSPLANLRKLRKLNLSNNQIANLQTANIACLANIPLEHLDLSYNVIITEAEERIYLSDIYELGKLTSLRELILVENRITDISALVSLTHLKSLSLDFNLIVDLSPLEKLNKLKTLSLTNNHVSDLTPLSALEQLNHLYLSSNPSITSLTPLQDLTQLKTLTLDNVPIGNQNLAAISNKIHLKILSLSNTQLSDVSLLIGLQSIEELYITNNQIIDISPLSKLTTLKKLSLQGNGTITSIAPLSPLVKLRKLDLQDVPVGDEISILVNFKHLNSLDIRNCRVSNMSILGELMSEGALQDDGDSGVIANVDIRDNPLAFPSEDPHASIRPYWENIRDRQPFLLPEFSPLPPPKFSVTGGFFTEPFDLILSTEQDEVEIRYTLDGSEPTRESLLYTQPIRIQSREGESNLYASITDVSPRAVAPTDEIFKVNIVRARVFTKDGNTSSPAITNSYLVDEKKRYSLPVISIAVDPTYLFDYYHGIYVMGGIYDTFYDPTSQVNPWERLANYSQRGQDWERPAHMEFFDVDGDTGFSQNVNIRIHGAASRELPQKSLRIYAVCETGCSGSVEYPLFPGLTETNSDQTITEFKTFLLRNSGNDWNKTLFRDALIQKLFDHTNIDLQAYQPAIVFINGEYWGIHNLRERQDEYYLQSHYGIAPEDLVILGDTGTLSFGQAEDQRQYLDLLTFVGTQDLSDPENYSYVQTQVDIENFIDYQILEIYSDNTNWPHVNIEFWRKRTTAYEPNTPYGQDGRWRWMVYDTDFAFGFIGGVDAVYHNNLTQAIDPEWRGSAGILLRSLLTNSDFKSQFIRRFADHLNTSFEPVRVVDEINDLQAGIAAEVPEHLARWHGNNRTVESWQADVDLLRYFAENRPAAMRQQLIDYFALDGTANLHLTTTPDMGYVRVNTVDIVAGTPGVPNPGDWSGVYFTDMPVELTAVPLPGYRFEKWVNASGEEFFTEELVVTLDGDAAYTAVFVEE